MSVCAAVRRGTSSVILSKRCPRCRARWPSYRCAARRPWAGGERKQVPVTLSIDEFIRRWCLHMLPKGFTKTRFYGGWSNTHRGAYVERWCHLLEAADAPLSDDTFECGPFGLLEQQSDGESSPECPSCGTPMILQGEAFKPSWRDVMASADRPKWYDPLHRSAETVAPSHSPPL